MEDRGDLQSKNNAFFDERSHQWDKPEVVDTANQVALAIRSMLTLEPSKTELLDFGCGTGNVTVALSQYIKGSLGIDASEGMVAQFNKKCSDKPGFSALALDITTDAGLQRLKDSNRAFDIIQSTLVFHHIQDLKLVVTRLSQFLKSEGVLVVADLEEKDATSFHSDHQVNADLVAHKHGFTETDMRNLAAASSMELVTFKAGAARMTKTMHAEHQHGGGHEHGHHHHHGASQEHGEHHHHEPASTSQPETRQFSMFLAVMRVKRL
ncbi:hypothetical protein SmJEL517_g05121 [Synchytrium microbalum]|uniref:Methyltransferase type 11 domain-containing protein n=1 Tax=Synchytrium microbalum TaxID=1806994 RepID=A0A507BNA2_9FUNG|nr:uncharacterized protein SmJEL517_g05121 [Synchytrium microbalum]TPX31600.1 hypothetical protein SmJEL517_g05121 [Synchytrium microbalum]